MNSKNGKGSERLHDRQQCSNEPSNIFVKVENIKTGELIKNYNCKEDHRKADKLENALLQKVNLDEYHVYQSIQI